MTAEQILEQIRIYLDMFVDECKIDGSIEHVDVVAALDALSKEANRKGFIGKK